MLSHQIVGYDQNYARVRQTFRLMATTVLVICCVAFIVSSFGSGDALYVSFAVRLLRIYMFFPFLNGLQPIIANFFTSIGKATKGIAVAITRQILFYCLQSLSCRYSLGLTELHMQGL
jgi:Na+-driven multidrug efflux pump